MIGKIVYQTDAEGFLVSEVIADESPLEPGVFLIPAGCVEAKPPHTANGQRAQWIGDGWHLMDSQSHHPEEEPPVEHDPVPLTPEQEQQLYIESIQLHLDNSARTFGYDDIKSAVTYAEEPVVLKFQLEGRAFRAWRSLVWDYCHTQLALVMAGERDKPETHEFVLELPELVFPEVELPLEDSIDQPVEDSIDQPVEGENVGVPDEVLSGGSEQPTTGELIAELPELVIEV